jgi:ferritin-like metal-binding protein YciE
MDNLTELLEEQIKDLYNAEHQLLKALPRMAKKASSDELKDAFNSHLEETRGHVERLEQVSESLDFSPKGKVCAAMKGLIEEGKEVLEEDGNDGVIDAALIAAAQRVEHYEMAAYGTVKTLASLLGHDKVAKLLDETLGEEKAADEKLTDVAESAVYPGTPKSEDDMGAEDEEDVAPKPRGGAKKKVAKSGK